MRVRAYHVTTDRLSFPLRYIISLIAHSYSAFGERVFVGGISAPATVFNIYVSSVRLNTI